MPAIVAGLRFPYLRVMLPRTRLAYVHLRNLLTDAKRDRSARLSGYVAVWLPEEFVVLYLQRGEVANATVMDRKGWNAVAISSALERIPAELFPFLMSIMFNGMVEIVAEDMVNYLVFHAGAVERAYLSIPATGSVVE